MILSSQRIIPPKKPFSLFIKATLPILFLLMNCLLSSASFASQALNQANAAFAKKDFSNAISYYQSSLTETSDASGNTGFAASLSHFIQSNYDKLTGSIPGNVTGRVHSYVCFQLGQCYVQTKNISSAVDSFDEGYKAAPNSRMGKQCLFEKAFCELRLKKYSGATADFATYLQSVKNDSDIDSPRAQKAIYLGSYAAYMSKDAGTFNVIYAAAQDLLPKVQTRIYFKKEKK